MTREENTKKGRKLTVRERLRHPHILAELVKVSMMQSSTAQCQFLRALEALATGIRDMLESSCLIQSVEIDHRKLWRDMAGKVITFVDGGVANVASLGSEPVAVRVGSYTVVPGATGTEREAFWIEKQLVAELFDTDSSSGLYEHLFEDPSKLRDAARFCLEVAAACQTLSRSPKPDFLFLHGALVNPVSAYADRDFPPFSTRGLEVLLPPGERDRPGRLREFVYVYLHLLNKLRESRVNVASVVERASYSSLVSRTWLDCLKNTPVSPGARDLEQIKERLRDYRISDSLLFHAILNEGEYLQPIEIDRNLAAKRPHYSYDVIEQYPRPMVTYVGVGPFAQPLRVEFFGPPPAGYETCIRLVIHSCRLMPNYAFPAGLDIVDKFAKVPEWMNKPINSTLATQLLRRAVDSGNPKLLETAKRMLCGTKRDWLYRPTSRH